jgi:sporulation protein YlmC with PRC-barrel domain
MSGTRRFISGLLVVSVVAMLCSYAWAQPKPGQTASQPAGTAPQRQAMSPAQMAPGNEEMVLVKTNQLIGKEVKNPQGEKLGVIHDIVLTPDCQEASYVALSYGGAFGFGGKLHAIPWQALHIGPNGEATLSATKQQLQEATSFSKDDWPSRGNSQWLGTRAMGESRMSQTPSQSMAAQGMATNREIQMRRVTHLTGTEVKNPESQDLGDIEEFVMNVPNGRIEYDVISFGGIVGIGEKYAAVPTNAVQLQPQNHAALLNTTKQTLESVAFSPSDFPNLRSPEYIQRLSKLFPATPAGSALGYVPSESSQAMTDTADAEAWGAGSRHAMSFNPDSVKTITGTVESVGNFKPQSARAGAARGLRLRVKTSEGNLVTVYAGPEFYAEQKDFFVMPGDEITVTGSETTIRFRHVILASELKKGGETLELRDKNGKPLWPVRSSQGETSPSQSSTMMPGESNR